MIWVIVKSSLALTYGVFATFRGLLIYDYLLLDVIISIIIIIIIIITIIINIIIIIIIIIIIT